MLSLKPLSKKNKNLLDEEQLILLGEIHGIRENVIVLSELLERIITIRSKIILAFEWLLSKEELQKLNDYIHGQTDQFPTATFFSNSDGRFVGEHVLFFKELRSKNYSNKIYIKCFDVVDGYSEKTLANALLKICRSNPESAVIAATGIVHAKKSGYSNDSDISMAFYILESIPLISIFIRYTSGTVIVEGEKYAVTDAESQIMGPGEAFDFELNVNEAHPGIHICKLTQIDALLDSKRHNFERISHE